MMNDPFSHEPPKPFHSSVYARVSRGNTIGSSSAQTFGQRAHIERNRSSISRYSNSKIGLGYIHRSGKPGEASNGQEQREAPSPTIPPRQSANKRSGFQRPGRQSFNEPTTRHNPYQ